MTGGRAASYDTDPWSPHSSRTPSKVAAVRAALPATAAGIYLNAGIGRADAARDPAGDGRAGASASSRVGRDPDDLLELLERMDEARAAIAAVIVAGPRRDRPDPLDDRRRSTSPVWAIDWRAGDRVVTTGHEHAGGLGPAATPSAIGSASRSVIADVGDGGDDEQTLAALDARHRARHGARRSQPRRLDDRRRAADRAGSASWPTPAAPGRRRRRPGESGRSRSTSAHWASTSTRARPRSGCSVRRGWAPCTSRRRSLDRARRTFAGHVSFATYDLDRRRPGVQPDARRFEVAGYHRPSVVGMARSVAWLSMYVGLTGSIGAGPRWRPPRRTRLAAIPGVDRADAARTEWPTLVTFRIAGWPADAAFDEIGPGALRDLPHDPGDRRAADQRRLLQHRGRARAVRRDRRAGRRPHAGDDPAAADPHDPRQTTA